MIRLEFVLWSCPAGPLNCIKRRLVCKESCWQKILIHRRYHIFGRGDMKLFHLVCTLVDELGVYGSGLVYKACDLHRLLPCLQIKLSTRAFWKACVVHTRTCFVYRLCIGRLLCEDCLVCCCVEYSLAFSTRQCRLQQSQRLLSSLIWRGNR